MKILIVDDIQDNRITIELLLEEFEDIKTFEAKDGQEAINMCREKDFDIVFMDIMMPNVDGIKATKMIKSFDKQVMIIAVSALDDENTKNQMLSFGAEDYLTKPIEDKVFYQRVKNYLQIVKFRKFKPSNKDAINHFSNEIYSRSIKFNITSPQSLAEFWDYYLNSNIYNTEALEDCIRLIYAYGQLCLDKNFVFTISAEENDENLYLTLSSLDVIKDVIIQSTLLKHFNDAIFILKNNQLSFRLSKVKEKEKEELNKELEEGEKLSITDYQKEILSKTHFNKTTAEEYVSITIITLVDKIEALDNIQVDLEKSALSFEKIHTKETITDITHSLELFAKVIRELIEFEHFAYALKVLNDFLIDLDVENASDEACKKFSIIFIHFLDDIAEWRNNIFIKQEANDIHCLDASLLSSCLQIQLIFEDKDIVHDNEDDFELF